MTNAEVVFTELERQGLSGVTLVLYNDKIFIEGPAEIDCDALVSAVKKARFVLPCPPDRSMGGPGLPDSLSIVPNLPWSMLTLEQLADEKEHWDQCVSAVPGTIKALAAARFSQSCQLWIDKRHVELAQRAPIGDLAMGSH